MANKNSSGGAAVAAGADYQQRVAAWYLLHLKLKMDVNSDFKDVGQSVINLISYETSSSVDDLVLHFNSGMKAFLQIKRSISFSTDIGSDFAKVIRQFLTEFFANPYRDDLLVLTVPSGTSKTITGSLVKILLAIRLNRIQYASNPWTQAESKTLNDFRSLVGTIYRGISQKDLSEEDFVKFALRVRISMHDLEDGMPLEKAVLTIIGLQSGNSPELIWSHMINLSLQLAKKRQSIDSKGIENELGSYFFGGDRDDFKFGLESIINGDLSMAKDYLLVEMPSSSDLSIFETVRFSDEGLPKWSFSGNEATNSVGATYRILLRSATETGMVRELNGENQVLLGRKLFILSQNLPVSPAIDAVAKKRGDQLMSQFKNKKDPHICIHCSKAVAAKGAMFIEVDEKGVPAVLGVVHSTCLKPVDRIIGTFQNPFFEANQVLKNFDHSLWLKLIPTGQHVMSASVDRGILGWNSKFEYGGKNRSCLKFTLSDGSHKYLLERGRVQTIPQAKIDECLEDLRKAIRDSQERGDPIGYLEDGSAFGAKSLVSPFDLKQKFLECVSIEAVRFSTFIDKSESKEYSHYAPLIYLKMEPTELLFSINGMIPLITDPLELCGFLDNWRNAGQGDFDYNVEIIGSDQEFDEFMRKAISEEMEVVVNPLFNKDGSPKSGMSVVDIEEIARHRDASS